LTSNNQVSSKIPLSLQHIRVGLPHINLTFLFQPPVFILSGSTGVGKSFVVDHLVQNFPGAGYKELLFYPSNAPQVVVAKLVTCEHNLLVLDGLYFKDSHEIASWTKRIQKEATAYNKPLWIILVFTTEVCMQSC